MTQMTQFQLWVLSYMRRQRTSVVRAGAVWVHDWEVRTDRRVAESAYWLLAQ